MNIRLMTIEDYDKLIKLFRLTPGIAIREADSKDAIDRYLKRNANLNFVAVINDKIIGCVMCGHDGRRGYLQHLIVKSECRNKGIGEKLFNKCLEGLSDIGIYKAHLFVFKNNEIGNKFWLKKGWTFRDDVNMYSYISSDNMNE
ncbi:MAG TPA: GNAT family N-acetyltransferase [Victivallales bacterium]|nr:GNAT family N-acetyltransferase [Victivallales bacterium]